MTTATENVTQRKTATQRLEDMEAGLASLYQAANNMVRDLMTLKEAVKLLGNKVDAVVKATRNGQELTDDVLGRIMVENKVEELTQKVTDLVTTGTLVKEEQVTENSFVVGQELDESGNVLNPRFQGAVLALPKDVQELLKGKQVGDTVNFGEGKAQFRILESYSISVPGQQAEAAAQETEAQSTATQQEDLGQKGNA